MSLIENKWQPFISTSEITWPDTLPFRVEGMYPDGSRDAWIIRNPDLLTRFDIQKLVSIRIYDVQDAELQLVRNLVADRIPSRMEVNNTKYSPQAIRKGSLDDHYVVSIVRSILQNYGILKTPAPAAAYPAQKVDVNLPRWIQDRLSDRHQQDVVDWLSDLNNDDYPIGDFLERRLGNDLLAVRKYPDGGRRVIVASGHSLAYTEAQKIYWSINVAGTLMEHGRDPKIMVGELVGKTRRMVKHRAVYHSGKNVITIGCQSIPFRALQELADREGWPKNDW